jgi:perosamine synthetase
MMIPWAKPTLFGREEELMREALTSTWISGGPFVERLEGELAGFLDVHFAIVTANGTAALHLAYLALGVEHGDEVIVPGFAYMGAANIAILCGATPVFVDVDAATWCLDPAAVAPAITSRTKAIVAVHTYGNVCNLTKLCELALRANIPLIEDAAESLGSKWRGKQSGTLGTIGTYSFHATKTITTGEGGMVVTADPELNRKVRLYRSHGMLRERRYYWHEVPGHNFRLTNFQAAMGCAQLEHLGTIISRRQKIHAAYRAAFEAQKGLKLQHFEPAVSPVLWAMAVELDPESYPQGRDEVMAQMYAAGVECRPGFYSASQQPIYRSGSLPISERLATQVISLPTYPDLTDSEIRLVSEALLKLRR